MISFFVPGRAVPGGSKRAFVNQHTGKVAMVDAGVGNREWKADVKQFAAAAMAGAEPLAGPLRVSFVFVTTRPKRHFRTGKNADQLRDDAPEYPTGKPDVLKLSRAVEDAMSHVAYHDDAQTVCLKAIKQYGRTPGVHVEIEPVNGDGIEGGGHEGGVKR